MAMINNDKDENIYLNITVHNDFADKAVYAEYSESRNQPLLDCPNDYEMSIIRFDMPSTAIPKFIMNRPRDLSITLVYPDENLISKQILQLFQISYSTDLGERDDYIWYFKQIVISVNDALSLAYADIVTQYEAIHGGGSWAASGGPQSQPYLVYDVPERLFIFYCPQLMVDTNTNRIELWFNYEMFRLFETFLAEFYGYDEADGKDVRLVIRSFLTNSETISGVAYYKMEQEYSSLPNWYRVYKIVIVSNALISRKEYITFKTANPDSAFARNIQRGQGGTVNTLGIVQDFDYSFFTPNVERITYNPTAEYRWVDLLSNKPLNAIDFKVYVQSEAGDLRPIVLEPNDNVNIKILFRKRSRATVAG